MKNKEIWFKLIFTFTFIGLSIFIILSDWAKKNITNTSIALILVSFIPWILKYIKSMEIFGVKTELFSKQEIEKVENIVKNIEDKNIEDKNIEKKNIEEINENNRIDLKKDNEELVILESLFSISEASDLITKLVLTRFELEKLIKKVCKKYNVSSIGTIQSISQRLYKNDYIDRNEFEAINEILPILNKAIHSDIKNVNKEQLLWVVEKGTALLVYMELRYKGLKGYAIIR